MYHGSKPWITDFNDPHYKAAARSIKTGTKMTLIYSLV